MADLIDTTEMYLRTIYELQEEGITPLRARIAERIGHSGPTVSQTVARMERDGLLSVTSADRHLELTTAGQAKAIRVMRKHRLAERLLIDLIGLDWPHVHDEACRWEHVISERVERRLVVLLGHPHTSPYGAPIPGLAELGDDDANEAFLDGVTRLDQVARSAERRRVEVVRLSEMLQTEPEFLGRLFEAGLVPGGVIEVAADAAGNCSVGDPLVEATLELPQDLARHVFVRAAPSDVGG